MYQVLARKWRPKTFRELVGQQHITQALSYALDHDRLHHAYLFTGTRGVGKTSLARIYAKSLNCLINGTSAQPCGQCEHCLEIDQGRFPDLIEVDAASRRGIDETKELLDNLPYAPVKGRYKVYLIDEVHMFTRESFNALLKTLEEPPPHVKFILATTDIQKVPTTVLSRCLQFHLKNINPEQLRQHLAHILQVERIDYEAEALVLLAQAARGSMRDGLSFLDQAIAYGQGVVKTDDVAYLLGAVPTAQIYRLLTKIAESDARAVRAILTELDAFSPDYMDVLRHVFQGLQQITVAQLQAQQNPNEIDQTLVRLAQQLPVELVQLWYQIISDAWQSMPYQPDMRVALEMTFLRMIALQPLLPETTISEKHIIPEPDNDVDLPPWRDDESEMNTAPLESSENDVPDNNDVDLPPWHDDESEMINTAPAEPLENDAPDNNGVDLPPWRDDELEMMNTAPAEASENDVPNDNDADMPPWRDDELEMINTAPLESSENDVPDNNDVDLPPWHNDELEMNTVPLKSSENKSVIQLEQAVNQLQLWSQFLNTLPVEDVFLQSLVEQSIPVSFQNDSLQLAVLSAAASWVNEQRLADLTRILSASCARKIAVSITFDDTIATPAMLRQQESDQMHQMAKQKLLQNPVVRTLMTDFHGKIMRDSICVLDKKESI
ncbi:DNA polymerase III subunit gamma/tau [Dichelobacter nodosus]|uniref:DNA polymerase III subunit gamma/tau n=1 Tax=Dichelobacter nodosus TaxID=870 RepID=UPI000681C82D|nr:DNA polymerase III subunit gamma/tau [Dichelobacter nodosus]AXM45741.1 DNA polymerase III subunit gamma/tau [Dichelobacter nodosus]TGA64495.1 DNA polymerase III subunit gamma/tau [Dichelobacter nodosus]